MNVEQIKNIEDLIELDAGSKIKSHTVKRLTAPGENYGSLILSVDISVQTPNGDEEVHAVAKMVPPNKFIQEVFNTQVTFRNEIGFFRNIVPVLQNFQREHGVKKVTNFAAKYYGSRLNLNKDESIVDDDAALVVENLKSKGYDTLDRIAGLDLDAAKLVIINLAELHAVPIALKLQKPDVFENEVKKYLSTWKIPDRMAQQMREDQIRLAEEIEELRPLKERILAAFDSATNEPSKKCEPFATIAHNDCWSNNNMFKKEGNKVVKSKMVDFQILDYGSPAKDVVFFIFSSVKNEVVKDHYDELVKLYYDTFISNLEELHCDVKPFTWEALLEEIDYVMTHSEFRHLGFMMLPIYAPKGAVQELDVLTPESMRHETITEVQKEKYAFTYTEFAKRGWI